MLKTLMFAAVAFGTATAAQAAPEVTADYHPSTQRYCLRETMAHPGDPSRMLFRNTCLSRQQWRMRGIIFDRPQAIELGSRR